MARTHWPSACRALLAEARRGRRDPRDLLADASRLGDPYYAAVALLSLAGDRRLAAHEVQQAAHEALRQAVRTDPDWRRAELLGELSRGVQRWERNEAKLVAELHDRLATLVRELPPGKARSDGIRATADHLPARHQPALLEEALGNGATALDDAKAVLKAATRHETAPARSPAVQALRARLRTDPDAGRAARLLAYLHLQTARAGAPFPAPTPFRDALTRAADVHEPADLLDLLRYFTTVAASGQELSDVRAWMEGGFGPELTARALSALAARADRLGHPERARAWVLEGLARAETIPGDAARALVKANLAQGLARMGAREEAAAIVSELETAAAHLPESDRTPHLARRVQSAAETAGVAAREPPSGAGDRHATRTPPAEEPGTATRGAPGAGLRTRSSVHGAVPSMGARGPARRHLLALYNTYEGKLQSPHLSAIARAAPLAWAFGVDLALVGFPVEGLEALVERARSETRIGEGGRYIGELARSGRLHVAAKLGPGLPGVPVATTPRPDPAKAAELEPLATAEAQRGRTLLVLMGVGPKGLPGAVLAATAHHVELTGASVPLETATVMGLLVERMRRLPTPQ